MIPIPLPPYFLIKISRQKQKDRKEKKGNIFLPTLIYMTRNVQYGEIVAIGSRAQAAFPEAKVGHILLVHHFVAGNNDQEARENHLVHQDEEFNYYVVTGVEVPRKRIEAYAIWDGEKIITSPNYIFLEADQAPTPQTADEYINAALKTTDTGLLVFKEWKESREQKEERQANLKKEIESLSLSGTHKEHVQKGIREREMEMEAIGKEISKLKFVPHKVVAFNSVHQQWFNDQLEVGSTLFVLNIGAATTIEFDNKEYRIVPADIKYLGFLINKELV